MRYYWCFALFLTICLSSVNQLDAADPRNLPDRERDSLIEVLANITDTTILVEALNALCFTFRDENSQTAIYYGEQAFKLRGSVHDSLRTRVLTTLVIPKINNGLLEEGIQILEEAEIYARRTSDSKLISLVLLQMGFCRQRMSMYNLATESYLNSLEIREKTKDSTGILNLYNRIGIVYTHQGNYEKALESFEVVAHPKYSSDKAFANANENIAEVFRLTDKRAMAIPYLKTAIQARSKNLTVRNKSYINYNLAKIYWFEGKLEDALVTIDTAFYYFEQAKLSVDRGESKHVKGLIAMELNRVDDAIDYFESALHYSRIANELETQSRTFKKLAECYESKGLLFEANEALKNHINSTDSLNKSNITNIMAEYEIIKQQEEEKMAKQNLRNGILAISGLLLTIISFLYFRNRSRKKANVVLQGKNEIIAKSLAEKEILLKEIHHRVKNNLQIVSSMLNLQTRHVDHPQVMEAIMDSRNRVKSMAMIHQNLYRENNLEGIYISTYLHNLCSSLFHSYKVDKAQVKFNSDIDTIQLDIDTLIPIGLIVNELITNSIKYAFPEQQEGEIILRLNVKEDHLLLEVSDNGIGL
ncbi:MAG: histidine kinase dimerization/phosphoacceptor domain -containing protein, partial [Bacteroidota bacterium]